MSWQVCHMHSSQRLAILLYCEQVPWQLASLMWMTLSCLTPATASLPTVVAHQHHTPVLNACSTAF